jgi:hypothetical protein
MPKIRVVRVESIMDDGAHLNAVVRPPFGGPRKEKNSGIYLRYRFYQTFVCIGTTQYNVRSGCASRVDGGRLCFFL